MGIVLHKLADLMERDAEKLAALERSVWFTPEQ
jgi:hypothetical protein